MYLIQVDRPYRHARHYRRWTENLDHRLAEHHAGRGSPLIAAALTARIELQIATTSSGDRCEERRLHRDHSSRAWLCPIGRREHQATRLDAGAATGEKRS
jgi:hypothetical protein